MFRKLHLVLLLSTFYIVVVGQDGTKSIKSEEYLNKRPENSKVETRSQSSSTQNDRTNRLRTAARSHVYAVDKNFPVGPPANDKEYVRLGVTIWRFSPTQCAIPDCPMPVEGTRGLIDTAGTRVDDNVAFSTGERVRIGLESLSHEGFIYVIDREQFADGTFGDPYLIFPTKRIHNGNNYARPGLQIQLPRAEGCFCVKSRNPQRVLVSDNLIVIVSPQPLLAPEDIPVKEIALPIKLATYISRVEKERAYRGTLQGGAGLSQTVAEVSAGTRGLFDTEPVLTQNDLPPQNFYQSLVSRGSVAVFSVSLHYANKP
jgi:hypothetical protein